MKQIRQIVLMSLVGGILLLSSYAAAATPWQSGAPSTLAVRWHQGSRAWGHHRGFKSHHGFKRHHRFKSHHGFKSYSHFRHRPRHRGWSFGHRPHRFNHGFRYFKHHRG